MNGRMDGWVAGSWKLAVLAPPRRDDARVPGGAVGIEVVRRFGEVRHRCGIVCGLTDDD